MEQTSAPNKFIWAYKHLWLTLKLELKSMERMYLRKFTTHSCVVWIYMKRVSLLSKEDTWKSSIENFTISSFTFQLKSSSSLTNLLETFINVTLSSIRTILKFVKRKISKKINFWFQLKAWMSLFLSERLLTNMSIVYSLWKELSSDVLKFIPKWYLPYFVVVTANSKSFLFFKMLKFKSQNFVKNVNWGKLLKLFTTYRLLLINSL